MQVHSQVKVLGSAEVSADTARALRRGWRAEAFTDWAGLRDQVLALEWAPHGNLENFHRTSDTVRLAQLLALLAVGDAAENVDRANLAIFGVNGIGCREENRRYWQDYVEHGKVMGRSRLFVTTLTTAPACEAALTLGSHGPIQTLAGTEIDSVLAAFWNDRPQAPVLLLELNPDAVSSAVLVKAK